MVSSGYGSTKNKRLQKIIYCCKQQSIKFICCDSDNSSSDGRGRGSGGIAIKLKSFVAFS